ncbi:MAG TPA: beta-ketoacyl-[acyl-carrier-protein] synthase family protein [Stellaceae bacterium]|nr:beta-ketoacyl-[acyl-carrier-protein] synthase family protein [Stellaceae bacterium]
MTAYLAALGIASPLGIGKEAVARNLFAGSRAGLVRRTGLLPDRAIRVGDVDGPLPHVPPRLAHFDCRNNRIALAAIEEIEPAIAAAMRRYGAERVAVVMGSSTSGLAQGEAALATLRRQGAWPAEYRYSQQELGNTAAFLAEYLGIGGPAYTISTACSSSGKVFASAERLLRLDLCDAALVGGADALCGLTLNGFHSLEAIAADYCNPFSRNRDGINIGEGAAVFLMTREPAAIALMGTGESSDAYHVSAPDPSGAGALRAMRGALDAARLPPSAIDYVNLHGTATPLNDAMEGKAVAALFGAETPCSATKAMTGHMLGAAGAAEAAILWLSLDPDFAGGAMPPHVWDGAADPEIPALNFATPSARLPIRGRSAMLSNSFGFGGSNVAVVLGRGW